jgi:hypothetical protein
MAIDLSKLTPQQLDQYIHIQAVISRQAEAAAKIKSLRAYYDGDHPVMLTERQKEYLGPLLTGGSDVDDLGNVVHDYPFEFAHNVTKTVVDMLKDRLRVEGFTVNGASAGELGDDGSFDGLEPSEAAAALMWQWWNDNRMDSQQSRHHKRALRDGYSFIMVDYDAENDRPRLSLHELDDGTTGIVLHRDPTDANRVICVSRYFYTFDPLNPGSTGKERKNVYLPGEIRKYIRGSATTGGWEPYLDDGDTTWPLPWVDRMGKPIGAAGIEFQDPDGGVISGIIGLQNALNKSWLDLLAAADTSGFPVLVAEYDEAGMGTDEDDDDLTDSDELRVAPGRMVEVFGGKVKRLEGANMSQMIDTVWTIVSAVGTVSRLPQHDMKPIPGVDFPSGEALKQSETGLVTKAEERQLVFGQSWADVMALAWRVQEAFGKQRLPVLKRMNIAVTWKDAQTRMEKTEAEVATLHHALNVPDAAVWRKLGYAPEEIANFDAGKRREMAEKVALVTSAVQTNQQRTAQGQQQTQDEAVING